VDSLEEFRALGIDFISYTENVDTTTPSGQLLFHIMGAVAQFERDLIAERVRAGIAHARAMGSGSGDRGLRSMSLKFGLREGREDHCARLQSRWTCRSREYGAH